MAELTIEIFSDVVCPWCFIGKRRLDAVVTGQADVVLRWRPYQLYPNLPSEGVNRVEALERRYGPGADRGRIPERIRLEGEEEGIEFRYDLIERTPNTTLAHRLLEFSFPAGLQHELAEALFQAYFCRGVDVGDAEELIRIAAETGLSEPDTREYLASDSGLEEVRAQLARAPELGISGVPGYYLADSFLLPGAQTSETMGQIIDRVRTRIAG